MENFDFSWMLLKGSARHITTVKPIILDGQDSKKQTSSAIARRNCAYKCLEAAVQREYKMDLMQIKFTRIF